MIPRQNWEREHRRQWPPIARETLPQAEDDPVFMLISVAPEEEPPQRPWLAATAFVGEVALLLLSFGAVIGGIVAVALWAREIW